MSLPSLLHIEDSICVENIGKPYIEAHGVRITPAFIEFKHAFEGRIYKQKIVIQNISNSKVCVQITPPTSLAYKIKCVANHSLSPGLSLVRQVVHIHSRATSHRSIVPIFIDDNRIEYEVIVKESASEIIISPKTIDFGLVDIHMTTHTKVLQIKNTGSKMTRFFVDTKYNGWYKIVADPHKGNIQPGSSVKIDVKMVCAKEGEVNDFLWIKCDKPYIIPVTLTATKPAFEIIDHPLITSVSIIAFPATYFGLQSARKLFIRNYSAFQSVFCILGEFDEKIMDFKQCQKMDEESRNFNVNPQAGIFESKQLRSFNFIFKPIPPKPNQVLRTFYFCTLHIQRLQCKYLSPATYPDRLFLNEDTAESNDYSWNLSMLLEPSKHKLEIPRTTSATSLSIDSALKHHKREHQTFYLHAIAEFPSVKVVPHALNLTESLTIGQQYTRVLEFTNCSKTLPIYVWYQKTPHVEVDNYKVHILPTKSIQVTVTLTPRNIECVNTEIRFDLKYHNVPKTENDKYEVLGKIQVPLVYQTKAEKKVHLPEINTGITPNYIREAGKFCHSVKFKSKVMKPRAALIKAASLNGSDLIAFPNDLQKSLRPWRGDHRVKTIFTRAPRYIAPLDTDYEMTLAEKERKLDTVTYYTNYTRKEAQKLRCLFKVPKRSSSNYDLTETNKMLCDHICLPKDPNIPAEFIHLTPIELYKITIDPILVDIGKVAIYSRSDFTVSIRNGNPFPIRIYLRPEKNCVLIPEGTRRIIQRNSEYSINLTYVSAQNGFYTTYLDLIINECCIFVINIKADVHRPYLTTDVNVIEFYDEYIRYIEITNPLNNDTYFKWNVECENFQVRPAEGLIKANSKMFCEVLYLPNHPGPSEVNMALLASDIPSQQIKLLAKAESTQQYIITKNLRFTNVPLNTPITKTISITNDFPHPKFFSLDSNPSSNITVTPMKGLIHGNSHVVITVTLKMTACFKFSEILTFNLTNSEVVVLHVLGNVVYPDVTINPKLLQFQKIPSSSVDTIRFVVANKSDAKAFIKFDISSYTEYTITEENKYWWAPPLTELVLEQRSSKELYMHFTPNNSAYDKFFLPMIINDILGPVTDNSITNQLSFYITSVPMSPKLSKILPMPRVASHSVEPKLQFSNLKINLNVCTPPYAYKNSYNLKITNVQKEAEKVCIRTDGLCHPFSITQISGPTITTYPNSIVYVLNPNEQIVFQILFEPSGFGTEEILLPIFLRSDQSSKPHNALQITGKFDPPTITPVPLLQNYKPGLLAICNVGSLKFKFKDHFSNCKVTFSTDVKGAFSEILENRLDSTNTTEVTVRLKFIVDRPTYSMEPYEIHCSCGASHLECIPICRENSFLSNYIHMARFLGDINYNPILKRASFDSMQKASLMSVSNESRTYNDEYDLDSFYPEYPFFPHHEGPLRNFAEGAIEVLQSWIFTQVFFGNNFYKIPTGFSYIIFDENSMPTVPYIDLLINLGGKEVEEHFQLKPAPEDDVARTKYLCDIYEKALQFLINLGGRFGYIRPEHLLDFVNYRLFMTHFKDEDAVPPQIDISDAAEYCALVKQAWLDVLFQTYKVMVLQRSILGDKKVVTPSAKATCPNHIKYMNSIKNIGRNQHLFSITELLLLDWMRFHYNEIRQTLWKEHIFMSSKDVTCFDDGIHDGFIFAALTISYCPYLIDHFDDMYFDPIAPEELSHNNIKVILAWQILNVSYKFTVKDLQKCNPARSLFLAVYLYQLLPNMYPSQTIEFEAGLSQHTQKSFRIKNANDFPVAYKAILYGSDDSCFKVDKELYIIQPKSNVKICIDYCAKFIKESKCTLILSGECKGYRYARSMVVSLIGVPDIQYVTDTLNVQGIFYVAEEIQLKVTSPYKKAGPYKIQQTGQKIKSWKDVETIPYKDTISKFTLIRITPLKDPVEFDDEGIARVDCCFCIISPRIINVHMLFRNPHIGDFAIKLITAPKLFSPQERLILNVPVKGDAPVVECKKDRKLILKIPHQNRLLWRTVVETFVKSSGADKEFWKEMSHTYPGIHVLTRLIHISLPPYTLNLCGSKRYLIRTEKNCFLKFPGYIDIEDECKPDFVLVPVKVQMNKAIPKSVSIALEAEDGLELRHYEIILHQYSLETDVLERSTTSLF